MTAKDLIIQWFTDLQISRTIQAARLKQISGMIGIFLVVFVPTLELDTSNAWIGLALLVLGAYDEYIRKLTTESMEEKRAKL